ncbi:MAG: GGDEF domain-containing protein [Pirellulaceae bacterium]|nr:MAG: GGDEF domain-containing protein [Pirellulaceae bacterium]
MSADPVTFAIGLAVGIALFASGMFFGWWMGRRARSSSTSVPAPQVRNLMQGLAQLTTRVSGEVSRYQSELSSLQERFANASDLPPEQLQDLLTRMMQINHDLQLRLVDAEQRLEVQTHEVESYLEESRTDALTGLLNRRAFDAQLDAMYRDWRQDHARFALCLIDIDHFKQINDTYGHPAGDEILRRVAAALAEEFATGPCVARYGGEEFAILSLNGIHHLAKRVDALRQRISTTRFEFDGQVIPVSLSAGVAEVAADDTIGNVVRRADEALYASKLGGRNRVSLHDGTICRLVTPNPVAPPLAASGRPVSSERSEALQARIEQRLRDLVLDEAKRLVDR